MTDENKPDPVAIDTWTFPKVGQQPSSNAKPTMQEVQDPTAKARHEAEQLKQSYEQKIQNLQAILQKIAKPLEVLDDEIADLLETIIKRAVKKLIAKEITLDNKVMPQLIDQLKAMLPTEQAIIAIEISAQDHAELQNNEKFKDLPIVINNDLNQGDAIVKTKFAEVRAIIDERIEQLLKVQNE